MVFITQRNHWWSRAVVLVSVVLLATGGCASHPEPVPGSGLGAAVDTFRAHHDARYSDLLTDAHGRVTGYILSVPAQSLAAAEALVKQDLPGDATLGTGRRVVGIEGTTCEIVHFTSATLGHALGGDHGTDVMAVFQTQAAVTLDLTQISHAVVVSGNEDRPERC